MSLVQIGGEDVTVTNTAIGPTATQVTDEVIMAEFQHRSGGDIFAQSSVAPVAAGGSGDFEYFSGNRWRVWGHDGVLDFKMIRQGSVSAVVAIQYFGTGAS